MFSNQLSFENSNPFILLLLKQCFSCLMGPLKHLRTNKCCINVLIVCKIEWKVWKILLKVRTFLRGNRLQFWTNKGRLLTIGRYGMLYYWGHNVQPYRKWRVWNCNVFLVKIAILEKWQSNWHYKWGRHPKLSCDYGAVLQSG